MKVKNYIQFINEDIEYKDNSYDSEWKLPISQERLKLERYLDEILLEITDLGLSLIHI